LCEFNLCGIFWSVTGGFAMNYQTMDILLDDVVLTVYYYYEVEQDPYGTGDSPTSYDVLIVRVEVADSDADIYFLLSNEALHDIEQQIIEVEQDE
jgi:hypothetical protein